MFLYKLALALGGMTVEEMLHRMSANELATWRAFATIEMIGVDREDLRTGIVASAIFNANATSKSKRHNPIDHMPFYKQRMEDVKKSIPVDQQVTEFFDGMMLQQKQKKG